MSYLDYPRLHFSGRFIADPSTINNTPNNYASENAQVKDLELYWNPNGTGVFDFIDCVVTKVIYGPGDETDDVKKDSIIGKSVAAIYNNAPPKIVDLDPDQQNVSEIWGLTLRIAGPGANPSSINNYVSGTYKAGPFNAIWVQAQNGPRSSASGSGVYQSTLQNLNWDTQSAPTSRFLSELQKQSSQQLSVNFVVNAHNNAPQIYQFNDQTLATLAEAPNNVPKAVVAKLQPMTNYIQNVGTTLGDVPTASYVSFALNQLLGQADAERYLPIVLKVTKAPYNPGNIDTEFPTGLVTGTIGPQASAAPVYYTPSRTLAPKDNNQMSYFAPVQFDSDKKLLTLNLGNALSTNKPGYDIAGDKLGKLSVVYFDQNQSKGISLDNAVVFANLPPDSASINAQMKISGGIFCLEIDKACLPADLTQDQAAACISSMPLGLVGTASDGTQTLWLCEQEQGYNLRADQFVYRMNPGVPSNSAQPNGDSALVTLYVTRFGLPAAGVDLNLYKLDQTQATDYTCNTLGTGGTRGIKNIAVPDSALVLKSGDKEVSDACSKLTVTTDQHGVATVTLLASNPGSPRKSQDLDGQVYFIRYGFADEHIADSFVQDVNDLISVAVYTELDIPAEPTWENCIKNILPQYQKLYPIMGRFELGNYQVVVENAKAIATVLSKPVEDALHMPVIRDLSIKRNQAVLTWIQNGTPKGN